MAKRIFLSLVFISSLSYAEMFKESDLGIGLAIGSGSITIAQETQTYALLGLSAEYFVVDNFSVGLGILSWIGETPTLHQFTLPVNYYIPISGKFRPYAGAFLRETLVSEGFDNYSSYGAKLGVAYTLSKKAYIAFALVNEQYEDNNLYSQTSSSYPEITFAFSF